jgi:hypothetical protein
LAVLRPTPGSASSASRSFGTEPPWFSTSPRAAAMMFFAFVRQKPHDVMMPSTSRCSAAASAATSG